MNVERYRYRQRARTPRLPCGCIAATGIIMLLTVAVGVFIIMPNFRSITLQLAGSQPSGDVASYIGSPQEVVATPVLTAMRQADDFVISAGSFGSVDVMNESTAGRYPVQIGLENNSTVAMTRFDETSLLELCQTYSDVCTPAGANVRNARFDIEPGGAIVTTDVRIPETAIWQTVDIVVQLAGPKRVDVLGLDVDGVLYNVPSSLKPSVDEAEGQINNLLNQISINANNDNYTLERIIAEDGALTAILR